MRTNVFCLGTIRIGRATAFAFGAAMIFAVVLFGLQAANPAQSVTRPPFTVNSIGDEADKSPGDGVCQIAPADQCTLRAAIEEANASASADTINFAIPGAGPHPISPGSELPPITQPVTIDGYTESLDEVAKPNTASTGTDAVLKIVLDGTNVVVPPFQVDVNGLELSSGSSNSVIRGLVINDFRSRAISLAGGTGHKIEGNFLGTDPSGATAEGNGVGVTMGTSNSTIGGTSPAARNLISGNDFSGIRVIGGPGGNKIEGNLIGTTADGSGNLGNSGPGVFIVAAPNNTIGDSNPNDGLTNAANTIAFNTSYGVGISESQSVGNRILSNSIFSNTKLGINLLGGTEDANDVTTNDLDDTTTSRPDPDKDTGPNNLQNYPDLDPVLQGDTVITGKLNSTPSTRKKKRTFTIQFFSSPSEDPSHFGEGKNFLGQIKVTTNRKGEAPLLFFTQQLSAGQSITATATNNKTRDTSEFSQARVVKDPLSEP